MLPALTSVSQRGARCLASCSSQFKSLKTATELVLDVGFNLGSFKTRFYKQKSRREVSDPKSLSFPFLLFGSSRQNDIRPVVLVVRVTRTLHMKNFLLQAEHFEVLNLHNIHVLLLNSRAATSSFLSPGNG